MPNVLTTADSGALMPMLSPRLFSRVRNLSPGSTIVLPVRVGTLSEHVVVGELSENVSNLLFNVLISDETLSLTLSLTPSTRPTIKERVLFSPATALASFPTTETIEKLTNRMTGPTTS